MTSTNTNTKKNATNKAMTSKVTNKQYKSKKKANYPSYIYPQYHNNIAAELSNVIFCNISNSVNCINEYDTNIIGIFECNNYNCNNKRWSSKKVAITIRMFSNNKYSVIVYNQRCKLCNNLGIPTIDEDCYTERVVYRIKKWLGYKVEQPIYLGTSKGPHESAFCEGCRVGHCTNNYIQAQYSKYT